MLPIALVVNKVPVVLVVDVFTVVRVLTENGKDAVGGGGGGGFSFTGMLSTGWRRFFPVWKSCRCGKNVASDVLSLFFGGGLKVIDDSEMLRDRLEPDWRNHG